jgi:hypothetical protein
VKSIMEKELEENEAWKGAKPIRFFLNGPGAAQINMEPCERIYNAIKGMSERGVEGGA